MKVRIQNKIQLIENGENKQDRKARKLALDSLETAVNSADPEHIIKSKLILKDSHLHIDHKKIDISRFRHVYVLGGGKASGLMARALEQVLGHHITCGTINVPKGKKPATKIVRLHEASHPIPDESGVDGTRQMLKIAEQAGKNDLIICLISGGGSSLMPLPRNGISIQDKRALTDTLLKSGAAINEINTVRKHISDFKGGWLARKAYPATVLNLILSDVVGDPLEFIASGPTVADTTTFDDAVKVLVKYQLWKKAPASIKNVLALGQNGSIPETPKTYDRAFKRVHNVIIGNCRTASLSAADSLKASGLHALMLTSTLEGEAKSVGAILSSIAKEIIASGRPVRRPSAVIAGGETTVVVTGNGKGGRNQEISLSAGLKLTGSEGVVVASLATDGVDGPTDAAGAIIDGKTMRRATALGLSGHEFIANNDSYSFFEKLGDLIFTGPTGTNVNDVSVVVVI